MRALLLERFGEPPKVHELPDPTAPDGGVVVRVTASGLCRSDWHAFVGHDPDVVLPLVLGHEFAGTVHAVGPGGPDVAIGQPVTAPFVLACGRCPQCRAGDQQVCIDQQQPGFTLPGSFADFVVVPRAAVNLVPLPAQVEPRAAAVLGCRFATAYRALLAVGRLQAGEWLAVHGCGGVGLSAVLIGIAAGARVIAVDRAAAALALAVELGAEHAVSVGPEDGWQQVAAAVRDASDGGVQVSVDALGSVPTASASLAGLRPRGRHVQVGLLPAALGLPALPIHLLVAGELQFLGSHGMAAHHYPGLLALVASGRLPIERLIGGTLTLDSAGRALAALGADSPAGIQLVLP